MSSNTTPALLATPSVRRQLKNEVLLRLLGALPESYSVELLRNGCLVIVDESDRIVGHVSFETEKAILWDPELKSVQL